MLISDWSSDVCSSDLVAFAGDRGDDARMGEEVRRRRQPLQRTPQRDQHYPQAVVAGIAAGARVDPLQQRLERERDVVDALAAVFARGDEVEQRTRSEEHTSELQSLMRISYAVFCLKKQTPP